MIRLEKKPLDGLGLEVSGGYRVGIYVIELQENSVCRAAGIQVGDRLLKVRHAYPIQYHSLIKWSRKLSKVLKLNASTCPHITK